MGYSVILAEKRSVGMSIAKIVGANQSVGKGGIGYMEGGGYKVTWAAGHLIALKSPEEMGFTYDALPIMPKEWEMKIRMRDGKTDKQAEEQLVVIKELFKKADQIVVATDAGREGELIFRYIYEYLDCRVPFVRLWISSLTDEAIRKGMKALEDGSRYDNLSDAAHSRSRADWLVGYNASRALRLYTGYKGSVSLGRVQTPTLAMICERYEANKNFVPTPYWVLEGKVSKSGKAFSVATKGRYKEESEANKDCVQVKKSCQMRVEDVEKKHISRRPPLLYDLTSLQRAANGKWGLTAGETLALAQELYEKKYISYPRTGARYISEDVFRTIPELLGKLSSYPKFGEFASQLKGKTLCRRSVNDKKVTDHHALLPTGVKPEGLSDKAGKIYEMILGRTIEAFGENYEGDVTTVLLSASGVEFQAKGSVPTYAGWKAVYGVNAADEENPGGEEQDNENSELPILSKGDLLPIESVETVRKTDKAPSIYTDSTLLGAMETCGKTIEDEDLRDSMKEKGLGTPATRATIIENLIKRLYVERSGKKLLPTELGLKIYGIVKGRKIAEVQTTGEWESKLLKIERGQEQQKKFDESISEFVLQILEDLKQNATRIEVEDKDEVPCCICGKKMRSMKFSITCDACGLKINREIAGKKLPQSALKKLLAGEKTAIIKGFTSKSGKTFDAPLMIDKEKKCVVFDFGTPEKKESIDGLACPSCGKELKEEKGKLVCDCGYSIWTYAAGEKLSKDKMQSLLRGEYIVLHGLVSKKSGKKYSAKFKAEPNGEIKMELIKN